MSASSPSLPFLVPSVPSLPRLVPAPLTQPLAPRATTSPLRIVRRRPTQQQGRALETLGHAIEYLVDSRMFLVEEPRTPAEAEAVQLLSRSSREIFQSCAEIVSVSQRLRLWAVERLRMGSIAPVDQSAAPRT